MSSNPQRCEPGQDHEPAKVPPADPAARRYRQKLPKSKKVFDNSKVTDHHAIIPTGVPPTGLTDMEANVYDLIAKRFISVFYPDCKFSTTTVLGEVINEDGPKPEKIEFKVSGKEILEPGWRVVYAKDAKIPMTMMQLIMPTETMAETAPRRKW